MAAILATRVQGPTLLHARSAEMRMSSLYKAYDAPLLPDDYPATCDLLRGFVHGMFRMAVAPGVLVD